MIPGELPEELLAQAEELFAGLTGDEATVIRLHADGLTYAQIAQVMGNSVSSVKSAVARAVRKKDATPVRIAYLVGVHDARAHSRALREDTVNVIVSRNGTVRHIEV